MSFKTVRIIRVIFVLACVLHAYGSAIEVIEILKTDTFGEYFTTRRNFTDLEFIELKAEEELQNRTFVGFVRTQFARIPLNMFRLFPHLEALFMVDCGVRLLNKGDFLDGYDLLYLNLMQNRIDLLKSGVFDYPRRLLGLNLNYNNLKELPSDVFLPLENLRTIHLEGNDLQFISGDLFEGNSKLVGVFLSNNQITNIDQYAFITPDVKKYTWITLANNHFPSVRVPSVEELDIEGSNVKSLVVEGTVKNLYAGGNRLREIKIKDYSDLEVLELPNNHLHALWIKKSSKRLYDLDLSGNPFNSMLDFSFKDHDALIYLSLADMNIQGFDRLDTFDSLKYLEFLDLRGNNFSSIDYNMFNSMDNLHLLLLDEDVSFDCEAFSKRRLNRTNETLGFFMPNVTICDFRTEDDVSFW